MLILEDFWRGNICPGEAKMRPHEEYALCYKRIGKCEDALNAALSPEEKKHGKIIWTRLPPCMI